MCDTESVCSSSSEDSDDLDEEVELIRQRLQTLGTVRDQRYSGHPRPQPPCVRGESQARELVGAVARHALGDKVMGRIGCTHLHGAFADPLTTRPVTINLSMCRYDVIRQCAEEMGWKLVTTTNASVWWSDFSLSQERVAQLHKTCRYMNHFPSMHYITQKIPLALNINRMRRQHPGEFDYTPCTFVDHREYVQYCTDNPTSDVRYWIVKPNNGAQGLGITLTSQPNQRDFNQCVVQQYIDRPLLIDGFKFDLRCYVLVSSCCPLRVFFYRDGFVRMATEKYQPPTEDNVRDRCMHLTNYSINKNSAKFISDESADGSVGHKRSFGFLNNYLACLGRDIGAMWSNIHDAVVKTFLSIQSRLGQSYKASVGEVSGDSVCFEVLGFDVMIDEALKPWLIEVNHSPSWRTDSPLDLRIKRGVILEAMALMNIKGDPLGSSGSTPTAGPPAPTHDAVEMAALMGKGRRITPAAREAHEDMVLRNFTRIYPAPGYERFGGQPLASMAAVRTPAPPNTSPAPAAPRPPRGTPTPCPVIVNQPTYFNLPLLVAKTSPTSGVLVLPY
uniref:Tubulin--tyrosine ligase-like protein 9 n=1 Tax=Eutreptiella gymnastica TaxID=73025 RepID=A0A7S1HXC7_9EUGL|mmetsp:Transcript_112542/g.195469  ORF Transcript_112542/g.195469 Transcript_112542/m.195469 type:complete len:559 (+) Transcript_112542:68-1744(+)